MTRLVASILFLSLAVAGRAEAELWTNQAGQVIEATFKGFDGSSVTLVRTNGMPLRLPLSALCKEDQRRVRLQANQSLAPDFVQTAYRDARSVLDRFERLPPNQQTPEARQKAVNMACSVFDARVNARAGELKDPAVKDEVKRLRDSLASPGK